MRQQQQALRNNNPLQRAQQMQRLQQQILRSQVQNQGQVKVVTEHKDLDLVGTSDTNVRLMELPDRIGPDGKPQPYTLKEKQELKGPVPGLVGYQTDFDGLSEGLTVKVILGQRKGKDKDSDKVPVKMILILPVEGQKPVESKKDKK